MIGLVAVGFRLCVRERLLAQAREQADQGLAGSMEGHAAMDMSVTGEGSFARRLFSAEGLTSVAHVFVMEVAATWRDLVVGLLVAGAIGAWVPESFWRTFFRAGHPLVSALWGPLVGPVVAIASFVCSIGNVPLAGVFYAATAAAGYPVELIFGAAGLVPARRSATIMHEGISWNYTTWLNIAPWPGCWSRGSYAPAGCPCWP